MKIRDILAEKKPTISFEIFPPNARMSLGKVMAAAARMAILEPDFMSVTYGAAGGTRADTVKIAGSLKELLGIPTIAHLTCVATEKEQVKRIALEMKEAGIENVLALRGDIQEGIEYPSPDYYTHANELVTELKKLGDFCIGGACYPEGHVEAVSKEKDLEYLKLKVDSGCDFLTTQMFFDNNAFRDFMEKLRSIGITVPVLAGIMPVTRATQITRIDNLSGASVPPELMRLVEHYGDNAESMMKAGIAFATEQILDLVASGVDGIHIYTMNKPGVAIRLIENLRGLI
ncbi:MAG: methylenetetrahydrofolate reductase [NAD(P)H] [Clostridiales bacterium]|nr:methylenetetrahydrofolate reductase [NAD(P)H] [Clostridiales bacterium]